jgi:hypothetical protein
MRLMKRRDAMAKIDYKDGSYSIAALSTQQYTFWWGRNSAAPHQFFDVSISPELSLRQITMKPLIQEKKETGFDSSEGAGRVILYLTLRNENNFAVTFFANHVRIY